MTKDFTAIARQRRLIALTEIKNRKENGATIAKIHTLPTLTNRHVDAMFRSSRSAVAAQADRIAA